MSQFHRSLLGPLLFIENEKLPIHLQDRESFYLYLQHIGNIRSYRWICEWHLL